MYRLICQLKVDPVRLLLDFGGQRGGARVAVPHGDVALGFPVCLGDVVLGQGHAGSQALDLGLSFGIIDVLGCDHYPVLAGEMRHRPACGSSASSCRP